MEKNKFVLKCFLGHFKGFKQLVFLVEKILLAKNDLQVMKWILYDTGRRTVVRRLYKRT